MKDNLLAVRSSSIPCAHRVYKVNIFQTPGGNCDDVVAFQVEEGGSDETFSNCYRLFMHMTNKIERVLDLGSAVLPVKVGIFC